MEIDKIREYRKQIEKSTELQRENIREWLQITRIRINKQLHERAA